MDNDPNNYKWMTFSCSVCNDLKVVDKFRCCSQIEGKLLILFSIIGFFILILTLLIQFYCNHKNLNDFRPHYKRKKKKSKRSNPTESTNRDSNVNEGKIIYLYFILFVYILFYINLYPNEKII